MEKNLDKNVNSGDIGIEMQDYAAG